MDFNPPHLPCAELLLEVVHQQVSHLLLVQFLLGINAHHYSAEWHIVSV